MLSQEYRLLDDGADFRAVAGAVSEAMTFLLSLREAGLLKSDFRPLPLCLGYHAPCHLKVLGNGAPAPEVLKAVPRLEVRRLDRGCCGIAGTYGMRRRGYRASLEIGAELFQALKSPEIDYCLTVCSSC